MSLHRHFLGWDRPVGPLVSEFLLAGLRPSARFFDLGDTLVVVPTRQAGRRLREFLAGTAERHGCGILPPSIVEPRHLLLPAGPTTVASSSAQLAAMVAVLRSSQMRDFPNLFPAFQEESGGRPEFPVLLGLAASLCEVRELLSDNALSAGDVNERMGEGFEEHERWDELALLESRQVERLHAAGLMDPLAAMRQAMAAPAVEESVRRVIVAAVPSPIAPAATVLERLAEHRPVQVLVHAPERHADRFDQFGRPLPEWWENAHVPLALERIHLVHGPRQQAECVARLIRERDIPPTDVAVGIPDPEITPLLQRELADRLAATTFDPSGRQLTHHPVPRLLELLNELSQARGYDPFSRLLRHPHFLAFCEARNPGFEAETALRQADLLQNRCLPLDVPAVLRACDTFADDFPQVRLACESAEDLLASLQTGDDPVEAVRQTLRAVYRHRILDPARPEDAEFRVVAEQLNELLDRFAQAAACLDTLPRQDLRRVWTRCLEAERYYFPDLTERTPDIEVEGWLELHWNDAPHLLLSGFNEGRIPASVVGDPFLPDSARERLGLTSNRTRFARDAYLLQAMLAARPKPGGVDVVLGKASGTKDALRPSRLLFLCPAEELPARALALFRSVQETRETPPRESGPKLRPPPVTPDRIPRHLSVTAFRAYLRCPLRFYLQRLLRMEPRDDRKLELDALDFGNVCHAALEQFGRSPLRASADSSEIADFLERAARGHAQRLYGPAPGAAVTIQLESACQRLRAAARCQAQLRREGWEILHTETPLGQAGKPPEIHAMRVRGTVDRVDRHPDGRIRILDYKTSDRPSPPDKAHTASGPHPLEGFEFADLQAGAKTRHWIDLQLPLYRFLSPFDGPVEVGYFNLPKAVAETGVQVWNDLDEAMLESARRCAEGVVAGVREGRFWPPAETLEYDDLEDLFVGNASDCVEPPVAPGG